MQLDAIPIITPGRYFVDINKQILKLYGQKKDPE